MREETLPLLVCVYSCIFGLNESSELHRQAPRLLRQLYNHPIWAAKQSTRNNTEHRAASSRFSHGNEEQEDQIINVLRVWKALRRSI
jgi:hypothetical protein